MRLGALLTPAGEKPDQLVNEAKSIEAEGFDSVWTAHAMGRGFMMHDPLVALAAAAAVTSRVELGTAILQLPIYHPTDVALKVATLMQIAGTECDWALVRVQRNGITLCMGQILVSDFEILIKNWLSFDNASRMEQQVRGISRYLNERCMDLPCFWELGGAMCLARPRNLMDGSHQACTVRSTNAKTL